ncbi:MAG TPA: EAL domain-containing protein [Acidimicrobiales bacterium]|nr:EAL domain-containing protein [Acidimicrobiales bacterium]
MRHASTIGPGPVCWPPPAAVGYTLSEILPAEGGWEAGRRGGGSVRRQDAIGARRMLPLAVAVPVAPTRDGSSQGRMDIHAQERVLGQAGIGGRPDGEGRYRRLLDGMAEGVAETTPSGEFVAVNRAFAEMLGYDSAEDLIGHVTNAVDLYVSPPQRVTEVQRVIDDPATTTSTTSSDVEFCRKDGTSVWIRSRSTVGRSPSGEVTGIHAIVTDITENRRAALHLDAILGLSRDAIIGTTTDGTVTSWSRGAARLFGFSAEEIIGQAISLIAPPDRTDEQTGMREGLAAGGAPQHIETIRRRKDGSEVKVLIIAAAATDATGRVVGMSVIAHDITDEHRAREAMAASEHQLSEAQRIAHLGNFAFDPVSETLNWSAEYYRILGLDPALEPSITVFASRVHPDDLHTITRAWTDATERGLPFDIEIRVLRAEADERRVRIRTVPECGDDGRVLAVAGTMTDDTEMAEAVEDRREAEKRFEIGFEQTAIGSVIADLDGIPTRVNSAVCRLLGRSAEELIGNRWTEFTHPDELPLGLVTAARHAAGHNAYQDERRYIRPDGATIWASAHVTLICDEANEPSYFFTQLQDITDRRRIESELAHQTLHDTLTGLPNRALLTDRLSHSLAQGRRKDYPVGVLFLDLDHFKVVNDSMGHSFGDDLLRLVGERIASTVSHGDTVARFGGDEFVIVGDDESVPDCERLAKTILDALSRPYIIDDNEINVTASLGIAIADSDATPETLLRDADAAMYLAKQRGRGRIELFDDALRATAEKHLVTTSALHHAIEREEFTVYYQPIVDLVTGAMSGVEALLRWEHPGGHLVSPDDFIPLAEQTGLIVPIGAWVLERACEQLATWQVTTPELCLAVNLSVRQILAPDTIGLVRGVLQRTGIPAPTLCFELTESLYMEDVETFGAALSSVKLLGVNLSIDDFGTGYSSLSRLKRFPVDAVKIDRSFVDGLGTDTDLSDLVAAIIALAAALDLDVIAEGVETQSQLDILRSLHCHRAQGFYLARPMPSVAMTQLIADRRRWPLR